MAPEVIDERPIQDELRTAADVYAVGAIAYELLTGRRPHPGRGALEILAAQVGEDPAPPSLVRPDLPPVFDEPILAALHRDPALRTASVEELRRQLMSARASLRGSDRLERILVVDDDRGSREAAGEFLAGTFPDARVDLAADGQEALSLAHAHRPDVVVTDLHMPRMSGAELVKAMREDPALGAVPVVVITGMGGARDWQALHAMGATGFLVKPVDPDALVAILRRAARTHGRAS
jgi:serine/threonine-protein kinase